MIWLARMPETIATIIAVSTDAMILFHSNDGIGVLGSPARAAARPAENRIPAGNSTELWRFRRDSEPGILSLPAGMRDRVTTAPITNPIILIPARLAATRLPGKPLAEIAGVPIDRKSTRLNSSH